MIIEISKITAHMLLLKITQGKDIRTSSSDVKWRLMRLNPESVRTSIPNVGHFKNDFMTDIPEANKSRLMMNDNILTEEMVKYMHSPKSIRKVLYG